MAQERENARARALRAARVVTLGLALAAVPACTGRGETAIDSGSGGSDSGPGELDSGSPSDSGLVADSGDRADSGQDSGSRDSGIDSGSSPIDSGTIADAGNVDAGCPPFTFGGPPPATQACCEAAGFFWDPGSGTCIVAVPGPFVPPSMEPARAA